jgi:hypothetical protein
MVMIVADDLANKRQTNKRQTNKNQINSAALHLRLYNVSTIKDNSEPNDSLLPT